ncbi:MAG: fused response regulator/phosphatase [Burkholderiales bacterium]|nr:fused response regulator/phosphatase [Burkholderiales bacterium]
MAFEAAGSADPALTVLVVDDDRVNRMWTAGMLKKMGHQPVEAGDAETALELFQQTSVDIVLMDVVLPGIDGFEAAARLRTIDAGRWVPCVFMSSLDEQQSRSSWTDIGDDYLTKPVDAQLFAARMRSLSRAISQERRALAAAQAMSAEQHLARDLMENMRTRWNNDDCGCVQTRSASLSISSGDCVLIEQYTDRHLYLMVADAMGHGLAAAVSLLPAISVFRAMARRNRDPYLIACEINTRLREVLPRGRFVSAALLRVDRCTGELQLINAGLPEIYLLGDGERCMVFESTQPPLGMMESSRLRDHSMRVMCSAGHRLFVCSDGVSEAFGSAADWLAALRRHATAADPVSCIDGLWQEWSQRPARDDATLLLIDFDALGAHAAKLPECQTGLPYPFKRPAAASGVQRRSQLLARLELGAPQLRRSPGADCVLASLACLGVDSLQGDSRVALVLSELLVNALDHGLLGLSSSLKEGGLSGLDRYHELRCERLQSLTEGSIAIEIRALDSSGHIEIDVKDSGAGFDYTNVLDTTEQDDALSGRGISLLQALCERIEHLESGTRTVATLKLAGAAALSA